MSDTSPPVTERERFWAALIEERAASGQTLREFAAREHTCLVGIRDPAP